MKWFFDALKKYAVFQGRARRKEYWYFFLFNFLFAIVFLFLSVGIQFPLLYYIYTFGIMIPGIAVGVRRMHDVDKSGWYLLIPIYNLVLACTEGTEGPNQYGSDPKRPEFEDFLNVAELSQS